MFLLGIVFVLGKFEKRDVQFTQQILAIRKRPWYEVIEYIVEKLDISHTSKFCAF